MLTVPSSTDTKDTGIIDSVDTDIYFSTDDPVVNIDLSVTKVKIFTATKQTQKSTGTGNLYLPHLPSGFPVKVNLLDTFQGISQHFM